jgi:signal transduction histidine kinase
VNGHVTVDVNDDGIGGADAARGSGLRGLADRVAAFDGTLSVDSPAGHGTRLHAEIPCEPLPRPTSDRRHQLHHAQIAGHDDRLRGRRYRLVASV